MACEPIPHRGAGGTHQRARRVAAFLALALTLALLLGCTRSDPPTPTPTPNQGARGVVMDSAGALWATRSFSIDMRQVLDMAEGVQQRIEADIDVQQPDRSAWNITVERESPPTPTPGPETPQITQEPGGTADQGRSAFSRIGNRVYLKFDGAEEWLDVTAMPRESGNRPGLPVPDPLGLTLPIGTLTPSAITDRVMLLLLFGFNAPFQAEPSEPVMETLDGVETRYMTAQISNPRYEGPGDGNVQVEYWIGVSDRLPRRIRLEGDPHVLNPTFAETPPQPGSPAAELAPEARYSLDIRLSGFGNTTVTEPTNVRVVEPSS